VTFDACCETCGQDFTESRRAYEPALRWCSEECRLGAGEPLLYGRQRYRRATCELCARDFTWHQGMGSFLRYCSTRCQWRTASLRQRREMACRVCGGTFLGWPQCRRCPTCRDTAAPRIAAGAVRPTELTPAHARTLRSLRDLCLEAAMDLAVAAAGVQRGAPRHDQLAAALAAVQRAIAASSTLVAPGPVDPPRGHIGPAAAVRAAVEAVEDAGAALGRALLVLRSDPAAAMAHTAAAGALLRQAERLVDPIARSRVA
jgi:hypothetical protein